MKAQRTINLLIAISLAVVARSAAAENLVFGIVPQQSAQTLAQKWTPLLQYLSDESGHQVSFATATNIPEFERRLALGEYDVAYMNPYHYTVFHENPGYEAFARQSDKLIRGIIVVRKDSPITSLTQLTDETLAFPAPAAFAASVLPRARLKNNGINVGTRYVRSHDSVYLTVARGLFKAGGGITRTLNNTDSAIRNQLRVLWTGQGYTPHAFAAHPRISDAIVHDLRDAMTRLKDEPRGQAILDRISFKGIRAANNSDWDDVRGLGLDLLSDLISN